MLSQWRSLIAILALSSVANAAVDSVSGPNDGSCTDQPMAFSWTDNNLLAGTMGTTYEVQLTSGGKTLFSESGLKGTSLTISSTDLSAPLQPGELTFTVSAKAFVIFKESKSKSFSVKDCSKDSDPERVPAETTVEKTSTSTSTTSASVATSSESTTSTSMDAPATTTPTSTTTVIELTTPLVTHSEAETTTSETTTTSTGLETTATSTTTAESTAAAASNNTAAVSETTATGGAVVANSSNTHTVTDAEGVAKATGDGTANSPSTVTITEAGGAAATDSKNGKSEANASHANSGLSNGAVAGIAVGSVLGFIALLGLVYLLVKRSRKPSVNDDLIAGYPPLVDDGFVPSARAPSFLSTGSDWDESPVEVPPQPPMATTANAPMASGGYYNEYGPSAGVAGAGAYGGTQGYNAQGYEYGANQGYAAEPQYPAAAYDQNADPAYFSGPSSYMYGNGAEVAPSGAAETGPSNTHGYDYSDTPSHQTRY